MEAPRAEPWAVADAPADYVAARIAGLCGLEIPIARLEGKWKASQNQPDENRASVVEGLEAEGRDDMAQVVRERAR
jgi:transcriptional regulator